MFPPVKVSKTGYVSEFTIEVNESRDSGGRVAFFKFTMTDDVAGNLNPVTFNLSRDSRFVSDDPAGSWRGMTFSGVQVAAVATLKDAYLHRKRVVATGFHDYAGPGKNHVELHQLVLSERSGPYQHSRPHAPRQVGATHARAARRRRAQPTP